MKREGCGGGCQDGGGKACHCYDSNVGIGASFVHNACPNVARGTHAVQHMTAQNVSAANVGMSGMHCSITGGTYQIE
jgi:hypothetical protein